MRCVIMVSGSHREVAAFPGYTDRENKEIGHVRGT